MHGAGVIELAIAGRIAQRTGFTLIHHAEDRTVSADGEDERIGQGAGIGSHLDQTSAGAGGDRRGVVAMHRRAGRTDMQHATTQRKGRRGIGRRLGRAAGDAIGPDTELEPDPAKRVAAVGREAKGHVDQPGRVATATARGVEVIEGDKAVIIEPGRLRDGRGGEGQGKGGNQGGVKRAHGKPQNGMAKYGSHP